MSVQRPVAVMFICLATLHGQDARPDQFDDFRAAEKMYNQAAAQCAAGVTGVECRVSTWNRLVSVYLQFGELGEAAKLLKKIQQAGLSALGECHPELAVLRSNQGGLEVARNNTRQALRHFEEAWKWWNCLAQPDLSLEAVMLNDWGLALLLDGQPRPAAEKLEKARRGFEQTNRSSTAAYVITLANLATAYSAAQDRAAGPLFEKAIRLAEQLKGKANPLTAGVMNAYARHLEDRGDGAKAKKIGREAAALLSEYTRSQQLGLTIDAKSAAGGGRER
jgi:tetratricopeptide (TPR) repeat protein